MRYFVTAPVPGGDAWWLVHDSQAHLYGEEDNFSVATFSAKMPGAEAAARGLCDKLNRNAA
jgi:hypothetical protein